MLNTIDNWLLFYQYLILCLKVLFLMCILPQVVRATNIIKSAMRFKLSLDETFLEPDVYHLQPQKSDTQWFKNIIRWVFLKWTTNFTLWDILCFIIPNNLSRNYWCARYSCSNISVLPVPWKLLGFTLIMHFFSRGQSVGVFLSFSSENSDLGECVFSEHILGVTNYILRHAVWAIVCWIRKLSAVSSQFLVTFE